MCRVKKFEIIAPYTLPVVFDDATEQVIVFEPVLRGELYGPLRRCEKIKSEQGVAAENP